MSKWLDKKRFYLNACEQIIKMYIFKLLKYHNILLQIIHAKIFLQRLLVRLHYRIDDKFVKILEY